MAENVEKLEEILSWRKGTIKLIQGLSLTQLTDAVGVQIYCRNLQQIIIMNINVTLCLLETSSNNLQKPSTYKYNGSQTKKNKDRNLFTTCYQIVEKGLVRVRIMVFQGWPEIPVVITWKYRPGKYSEFQLKREILGNMIFRCY